MRAGFDGILQVERGGAAGRERNEREKVADANVARIAQRKDHATFREEAQRDEKVRREAGIFFDQQTRADRFPKVRLREAQVREEGARTKIKGIRAKRGPEGGLLGMDWGWIEQRMAAAEKPL